MSGSFYLPLWTDAYLGDTQHLTTLQHGIYLLLLMSMWRNGGSLPADEKLLARYARLSLDKWRKNAPTIMDLFDREGDEITQKRLRLELEKTLGLAQKRALAGSAGGRAKSLKNKGSGPEHATGLPEQNRSLQNQIQNQNHPTDETANAVSDDGRSDPEAPRLTAEQWQAAFGGMPDEIEPSPGADPTPAAGDPVDPPATTRQRRPDSDYAFRTGNFRILETQVVEFEKAYRHIDVRAELMAASSWAVENFGNRWFNALKGHLRKKNEAARQMDLDRRAQAEVQVEVAGKPQRSRFQI